MLDAIKRYDLSKMNFKSYATFRIIGTIRDYIRQTNIYEGNRSKSKSANIESINKFDDEGNEIESEYSGELDNTEALIQRVRDLLINRVCVGMGHRNTQIFLMYYTEGKTLKDIGDHFNVTGSLVCQILKKYPREQILALIREHIA